MSHRPTVPASVFSVLTSKPKMHRRRLVLLAVPVAAAALLAAGCGGDSSSGASPAPYPPSSTTTPEPPPPAPKPVKPWRNFKKAELPKIALQPKDAPVDLVYLRDESGPKKLADELILPRQQRQVRSYGFLGMHDAIFGAKSSTSDRRVVQRIWLFKDSSGAKGWMKRTKQDAANREFSPVDAPVLGEESWAARGLIQVGGGQAITHSFRLGNAVFTVLTYGSTATPTEEGALAAAEAALVRAKASS